MKKLAACLLCLALLLGVMVLPVMAAPITVHVPASHEVYLGETLDLYCSATSESGAALTYVWYETATGKIEDIFAVNRGTEINDTFRCDTTEYGTRYYVCMVSDGTDNVYSDIISVRVISENAEDNRPVLFTADSEPIVGGQMTVDIKKMTDYDAGIYNAFLEGKVGYEWYRDDVLLKDAVSGTLKLTEKDAGSVFYVIVKGYDISFTSAEFEVEKVIPEPKIKTKTLPEAIVGEEYSTKVECQDPEAELFIYYNPGKANDFEKTGLTLKANGKITGKPTKAGEYTFTVCASNEGGEDYCTYTLLVNEPATDPTETTQPATEPVETTAPVVDGVQKPENSIVMAPDASEPVITIGAAEDNGMAVMIAIVIGLAVLAAVAATVVVIVLILRKKNS